MNPFRAVPALLAAAVLALPACTSGHNVPDMDERAAVPRTTPIPPPPAGTVYPRPSAMPTGAGLGEAVAELPERPVSVEPAVPAAGDPPLQTDPPAGR
jgi:hypothetical protein